MGKIHNAICSWYAACGVIKAIKVLFLRSNALST